MRTEDPAGGDGRQLAALEWKGKFKGLLDVTRKSTRSWLIDKFQVPLRLLPIYISQPRSHPVRCRRGMGRGTGQGA